ncbi:MAG: glycosyltransferase family 2 protein [Clostridia bacterium]|nr:glycosyltransferase family 2 protein [Clostridia bacterium]
MKISILTATYNRANLLPQLYKSLKDNLNCKVDFEWLIMDDGSTDETKKIVEQFIDEKLVDIKYFYQENQGKMSAINNLVPKANGDLIIECDSDDFFTEDAFEVIKEEYEKNKDEKDIYALCFLKYDTSGKNMGRDFKKEKSTMFDLYFKEGEDGEKALVYFSDIRKKYKYKLEHNEKFVTEARLHHEMDLNYNILCVNKAIMICEYQQEGYSKNIIEQFKKNPYGYYEYFKEILERDFSGVKFNKRVYVIKHYILFSYLTKKYQSETIKNVLNKLLYYLLLIPGKIKSKKIDK